MTDENLTERQSRERVFYQEYAAKAINQEVSFHYLDYKGKRPANSYWNFYDTVFQIYNEDNHKLLDFGCGGGDSSIRFAKFGFDVVAGIDILHHVDIEKSIKEIFRVLKDGGVAIFREHFEIPLFDASRNSKIGLKIVPKRVGIEHHITADERKLDNNDITTIKNIFPEIKIKKFLMFSRVDAFLSPDLKSPKSTLLEKIDYYLFKIIPPLKRFGGAAVIILNK